MYKRTTIWQNKSSDDSIQEQFLFMKKFITLTLIFLMILSIFWTVYLFRFAQSQKKLLHTQEVITYHSQALTQRILIYRELLKKENEAILIESAFRTHSAQQSILKADDSLPLTVQNLIDQHLQLIDDEKTELKSITDTKKLSAQALAELVARQTNLLRAFETELALIESSL